MELRFMNELPMKPELITCPYCEAPERIGIHSKKDRRYKCHNCHKSFTETSGTVFYGLHYPVWLIVVVLSLLAYGCPVPAIVGAFLIDERTIREWLERAGQYAKNLQEELVCNGKIELGQVQADELCINTQKGKVWMATAMSVFSRLFIWGVVSVHRDKAMILKLMTKVKCAAKSHLDDILIAVDGFSVYMKVILKTFYSKVYTGLRGRPCHKIWENLHIVQVIKSHKGRRLANICRKVVYGCSDTAYQIITMTQIELGRINTAFIERLNGTFRNRMPSLVRRTRNLALKPERLESEMFWSGLIYNFCTIHSSLGATPAMAADLTDKKWSVEQLLKFKIYNFT